MATTTNKVKPHGSRYPWDVWFKRKQITLVRGKDFPAGVRPHGFASTAHQAAYRLGVRIRVQIGDDWVRIQVVGTRVPGVPYPPGERKRKGEGP